MRRLISWIKKNTRHQVKLVSIVMISICLVSVSGALYANRDQAIHELHQLGADAGLKLQHIKVRGRSHIEKDTLLTSLNLELDVPIFSINLHQVYSHVSQIGWVKNVVIERRLPSTIYVTIEERVPLALLQNDSTHQLIDVAGVIIDGADPRDFTHLKVVSGKSAATNAAHILEALRTEPELFSEVWAINFRSGRRWDVHMKNGLEIRLPETNPIQAWSRLAVIDREQAITSRDLAVIDLRMPQQLIIEPNIPVRGEGSQT